MLVLSRFKSQEVVVTHVPSGDKLVVRLVDFRGTFQDRKARLGFTAGDEFVIHRSEVQNAIDAEVAESVAAEQESVQS